MERASCVERLWLAMSLAQLWCLSLGCQAAGAGAFARSAANTPLPVRAPATGHWTPDTRHRTPGTGYPLPDTRHRTPARGNTVQIRRKCERIAEKKPF